MTFENWWLCIGLFGQILFSARFIVQWIVSEKQKKSTIPVGFWYLSLGGGILLFVYATYKQDPVFMIGQGTGLIVYLRNLYFIRHERSMAA